MNVGGAGMNVVIYIYIYVRNLADKRVDEKTRFALINDIIFYRQTESNRF